MAKRQLQLTLAILKPDVTSRPHIVQEIRNMILENNFYFIRSQNLQMSQHQIRTFYKEHEGKFFHNRLVNFMSSGRIWTHILAKENAIKDWRNLMGPTKVFKTVHDEPDSIRGRFGLTDTRNCTHGSDSEETARREIKLFFPDFNEESWRQLDEQFYISKRVNFNEELCLHLPDKKS
ncbi:hypothetical protein SNE40_012234 [Patella caerulea]|uniref:Nucleoside diphosphate kinase n=1 Tax=Patella caerulea TaxID=87958 RepID=A0AAN8JP05_PATCE